LVPTHRNASAPDALTTQAQRRTQQLAKLIDLEGKRVLELGRGRGLMARVLAEEYGCDAHGLDVRPYDEWDGDPRFHQGDIADPPTGLGQFDVIVSFAVWEHVEHPYTALERQRELLAEDGICYLYANLYRGPKASHRYRDIYFPWAHLLFSEDVFTDFYAKQGIHRTAAWVNKLVYAQYSDYFDRIGYGVHKTWPSKPWWDEAFYQRFEWVLGRYPRWDLQHDFIHALLTKHPDTEVPSIPADHPVSMTR
jgi:SAM-dependent methyltransferase